MLGVDDFGRIHRLRFRGSLLLAMGQSGFERALIHVLFFVIEKV